MIRILKEANAKNLVKSISLFEHSLLNKNHVWFRTFVYLHVFFSNLLSIQKRCLKSCTHWKVLCVEENINQAVLAKITEFASIVQKVKY